MTRMVTAAALMAGAMVAVALGVYGNVHDPTELSLVTVVFTSTINLKVWLATFAVLLAGFQLGSALRIYRKIGKGPAPAWVAAAHRLSGTLAFLFMLPVAYHCLWALGFQADVGARVLVHSLAGTVLYGAFATKVLFVRSPLSPNWGLPVLGGLLLAALVVAWLTSSVWFWTNVEFPGL